MHQLDNKVFDYWYPLSISPPSNVINQVTPMLFVNYVYLEYC